MKLGPVFVFVPPAITLSTSAGLRAGSVLPTAPLAVNGAVGCCSWRGSGIAVNRIVAGSLAGTGRAALAPVLGLLGDADGARLRALSAGCRALAPFLLPLAVFVLMRLMSWPAVKIDEKYIQ